ncbi:hypothetical protein [Streptomyces xanthophaeus]|uniref:hypothetical protein n=1 Tax=Streptomyces xanthophaeus TaxID=67385 RepID=UPI003723D9A5
MTKLLLEALDAPLRVLRLFASEYPHLPAPAVSVSTVYPELLELSFHDNLAGFEAWREALKLDPGSVSYHVHAHSGTRVLKAETTYAGAGLCLVGFAKIPTPGGERSWTEGAS